MITIVSFIINVVLYPVCRALGIPCRPVTGFDAAHDSGGSLTIDIIQDEDGNILEDFTNDSVWNYHVWNEVNLLGFLISPGIYIL